MGAAPPRLAEVLQCLRLTRTGFFFAFDHDALIDRDITMADVNACTEYFGPMMKDATDQERRDFVMRVPWADPVAVFSRGDLSSPLILIVGTLTALMEASAAIMIENSLTPEDDAAGKE